MLDVVVGEQQSLCVLSDYKTFAAAVGGAAVVGGAVVVGGVGDAVAVAVAIEVGRELSSSRWQNCLRPLDCGN